MHAQNPNNIELIRRALNSAQFYDDSFIKCWSDDFPQTPCARPNYRNSKQESLFWTFRSDNRWRDDDGTLRTCLEKHGGEWILHEWVFAMACLMLYEGRTPAQIKPDHMVQR